MSEIAFVQRCRRFAVRSATLRLHGAHWSRLSQRGGYSRTRICDHAHIMDALAEKGLASVTRVIPDPHKDIGLNILSQFHYGPEIKIATFETLADALQSLVTE